MPSDYNPNMEYTMIYDKSFAVTKQYSYMLATDKAWPVFESWTGTFFWVPFALL